MLYDHHCRENGESDCGVLTGGLLSEVRPVFVSAQSHSLGKCAIVALISPYSTIRFTSGTYFFPHPIKMLRYLLLVLLRVFGFYNFPSHETT